MTVVTSRGNGNAPPSTEARAVESGRPISMLRIEEIDLRDIMVEIEGKTPLLTCRPTKYERARIAGIKPDKDQMPTEEQIFAERIYRDDENRPCFPGAGIRRAMVDAGRSTDEHMTVLRQIFAVNEALIPIITAAPDANGKLVDYPPVKRLDEARNKKGELVLAIRAEFKRPWRLFVPITYNAQKASRNDMLSLLNLAGFAVGIGAWRQEKMGIFGQFQVVGCEDLPSRIQEIRENHAAGVPQVDARG